MTLVYPLKLALIFLLTVSSAAFGAGLQCVSPDRGPRIAMSAKKVTSESFSGEVVLYLSTRRPESNATKRRFMART
jgi:hypothetical protein